MTGEEIAVAAERLRAQPGVLDVSIGTASGKKGRPLVDFRLLAPPHAADGDRRAPASPRPRRSACACATSAGGCCARRKLPTSRRRGRAAASRSRSGPTARAPPRRRTTTSQRAGARPRAGAARRRRAPRAGATTTNERAHRAADARARAPRRRARPPRPARDRGQRRRRFDDARARRAALRAVAADDVPRDGAGGAGGGARPRRGARRAARLAAGRARRRRAGRCALSRQSGRPLLLLQVESVRAHPRADAGPDRLRHQPRRSRRLPARPARRGRSATSSIPTSRRRIAQGAASTRSRRGSASPTCERLPAQPCLASRVETGIAIAAADLAFIDAVETRLAAALGGDAVLRCRVTHAGVVIELADAGDAPAAAAAQAIGADACRARRPHVRRRAPVPRAAPRSCRRLADG